MTRKPGKSTLARAAGSDEGDGEQFGPVVRAIRLISALVRADQPLTGKEISELLDLPPSTVHRLLQLLCRIGIVERKGDGLRYHPGPEIYQIAYEVMRRQDVLARAQPYLQAIVDEFNITVAFWVYAPSVSLLTAGIVINSSHPLDFRPIAFAPRGLAWGSVGWSVLAHVPAAEVDRVVAAASLSPTGRVMPPRDELERELADIRRAGCAFSDSQTISSALGFAAAVFDYRKEVVGCLSATIPSMRYDPRDKPRYMSFIAGKARALSEDLGNLS